MTTILDIVRTPSQSYRTYTESSLHSKPSPLHSRTCGGSISSGYRLQELRHSSHSQGSRATSLDDISIHSGRDNVRLYDATPTLSPIQTSSEVNLYDNNNNTNNQTATTTDLPTETSYLLNDETDTSPKTADTNDTVHVPLKPIYSLYIVICTLLLENLLVSVLTQDIIDTSWPWVAIATHSTAIPVLLFGLYAVYTQRTVCIIINLLMIHYT